MINRNNYNNNTNDEIMKMVHSVSIVYLYDGISYISYDSELSKQSLGGDIDNEQIVKIFIGKSVTSIESGLFSGCTNLVNITYNGTMDEWNEVSLGTGWIEGSNIETITCIDGEEEVSKIEPTVIYLTDGSHISFNVSAITSELLAPYCHMIEKIIFGEEVVTIGQSAFTGCTNLKNIEIPYYVTSIEAQAFYGLTNITIKLNAVYSEYSSQIFGNTTTSGSTAVNQTIIFNTLVYPSGYSFSNLFTKGSSKVSFTYNVYTAIDECKTQMNTLNNDQYTTVNVYDYVVVTYDITYKTSNGEIITPDITKLPTIISNTYDGVGKLVFEKQVIEIGDGAFTDCVTLTEITIPNTVNKIGINAFNNISGKIKISKLYKTLINKFYTPVNGMTYNIELNVISLPVSYNISNILNVGNKNNVITINVFTDDEIIKKQADNLGNQFTTVNTYHINGLPWGDASQLYPVGNEIWYNAKSKQVLNSIINSNGIGQYLQGNVYEYGIGKLIFNSPDSISVISSNSFNLNNDNVVSIMFPDSVGSINTGAIGGTYRDIMYMSIGSNTHIAPGSITSKILYLYYNNEAAYYSDYLIGNRILLKTLDIVCKDGVKKLLEQQPNELIYYSSYELTGYKQRNKNVNNTYDSSSQLGVITYPLDGTTIDDYLTMTCPNFVDTEFALSTSSVSGYTSVFLPEGITKIENSISFYSPNILISIPESVNEISGTIFEAGVYNNGSYQTASGIANGTVFLIFHKRTGQITGLSTSLPPQNDAEEHTKGTITYYILTDNQYIVQEYRKINKPYIIINLYRLNFTPW